MAGSSDMPNVIVVVMVVVAVSPMADGSPASLENTVHPFAFRHNLRECFSNMSGFDAA